MNRARFSRKLDTFNGVEAYLFLSGEEEVVVAWALENIQTKVAFPEQKFIRATSQDGAPIGEIHAGDKCEIPVSFEPVYIILSHQ